MRTLWGDLRDAAKWYQKHLTLGGSDKGATQSVKSSAPMGSIPKNLRPEFIESLSACDKKVLDNAIKWFNSHKASPEGQHAQRNTRHIKSKRSRQLHFIHPAP